MNRLSMTSDRNVGGARPDHLDTHEDGSGARLLIDLDALADNWQHLRDLSAPARCAAVVKADGYGLGLGPVVSTLYAAGCRDFFVATAAEGVAARQYASDARVYVMNCILPGIERACRAADLIPVLASMQHVAFWTQDCIRHGDHPCALQVDTGMHRLGLSVEETAMLAADVTRPAGFSPILVMSHLACGDQSDHPMNDRQRERFTAIAAAFEGVEASLSNSAGILAGDRFLFDLTRPGIALYGGRASNDAASVLKPVVTAQARIMVIRHARAGETVGYGAAAELDSDRVLAVCSVGYADGYMRAVSGAGTPLRQHAPDGASGFACGQRVPVIGRVTMDITTFDITDLPAGALQPGDFIELFGPNIPIDEVAATGGTIDYELLTGLGRRYFRHYQPTRTPETA